MAQPETLRRRMSDMDRLILRCRKPGCRFSYVATRTQAIRRFGETATAYRIEQTARCPLCKSGEIDLALATATDRRALPARDGITLADVDRLGLSLSAQCGPCRHSFLPLPRTLEPHRRRPLGDVFAAQLVRCQRCDFPACGVAVERPHPEGGVRAEVVHAWWEPGSPADPQVLAYWERIRKALAKG